MKSNQPHSSFVPLYKTMVILFLTIIIVCFPLLGHATNVDSLKHVLKTSDNHPDNCSLLFEIYKHYETIGLVDSMNVYARICLKKCTLGKREAPPKIKDIITEQYKLGFASNINRIIDSLLILIKDPELKLQVLVNLSASNLYYGQKDGVDKYWRQAEKALTDAKEDYSRFIYYTILGNKSIVENKIFTALQSLELAGTFVKENSENHLRNNTDLANIYLLTGEYEQAKNIYFSLLKNTEKNDFFTEQCYIYFGLMNCYYESGDYNESIRLAHKSIQFAAQKNLIIPIGYSYNTLGESYLALSNRNSNKNVQGKSTRDIPNKVSLTYLDSAKYYLEKGIAYSLEHNQSKELADNYITISEYYKAIGNHEKVKLFLRKAQKEKSYYDNLMIDKKMAELGAADKNYSQAHFYLDKYTIGQLQIEENTKEDMVLATKIIEDSYSYKEDSEVRLSIAKQKEKRLQNIFILTIAGLVLFSVILTYIYKNRKKLELLNEQISQRNKEFDILINKQNQSIEYLDNFASMAAHDLKAPIRSVSAFADVLAETSADDLSEEGVEQLNFIGSSVSQLSTMIDDLLSLSRLDAKLPPPKEADLNEIVSEVELLLSDLLKRTNAKIVVESTLPKVMGHTSLLSQLFQNLIKNAIVHNKTENNAVIKIKSTLQNDNSYIVKITDNSGGIPEYIVPTMFDLFSSTNKNTGNGIGLATCKKIVNHYGGKIWVDVEKGIGSTFNFNLFE